MANGRPNPSALSARDHRKIEETIRDEVLRASRFPTVRFVCTELGDGDTRTLTGTVSLSGRERTTRVQVHRSGTHWIAETTLHQPDFGMTPYSAMLGTLRIQPDVRVRLEVPA
jgi:polyisoprenoid-binding protein YceI